VGSLVFHKQTAAKIRRGVVDTLDTLTAAFTDPITFATEGRAAAVKKSKSRSGFENLPRTLGTTVVAGAAVLGAGTPIGRGVVAKVIPKTPKGALVAAVGIPTGVAVLSGSKKARKVVKGVLDPRENLARGARLAEIIEGTRPIPEGVKQGLKSAGIVGGILGGGAILAAVIPKIKGRLAKKAEGQMMALPLGSGRSPIIGTIPTETLGEEKVVKDMAPTITIQNKPKNTVIVQNVT